MDEKQTITISLVLGSGIGSVLLVLTDFPGWIGIGAGLGMVFGAGYARSRGGRSDGDNGDS